MYKEIIDLLISLPLRSQIKIDFDLKKKIFLLKIPIFSSQTDLPQSVKTYVEARKNSFFKPHSTSYQWEGTQIHLVQEISFSADFQATLRKDVDAFWQMSKHCKRMLSEIAIEEKFKGALRLDSHFEE